MRTRISLVIASVLCGAGLIFSGADLFASRLLANRGEVIAQPSHWVSFHADYTRTYVTGQTFQGRLYRNDDGSVRYTETSVTPRGATVHHIQNFADGRYYQSSKVGEWISGPLPAPGPRKLLSARSDALRKYTPRLALLAGQDGSIHSLDGLEAWISTTNDGSVHMLAPALNLFPVISNQLNGHRRVLSNIVIGAVDPALFKPPSGDNVTEVAATAPAFVRPAEKQ